MLKRLALLLVLFASPVAADDVFLSWDPSAGATGYIVHIGTQTGVYPIAMSSITNSLSVSGLAPQTEHFMCITAINVAGESACSSEVSGWSRPTFTGVVVSGIGPYMATVTGNNFADTTFIVDATYNGLTVSDARRISPTQIEIDYALDATAISGFVTLTVSNSWGVPDDPTGSGQVAGVNSTLWQIVVTAPTPPVNLRVD